MIYQVNVITGEKTTREWTNKEKETHERGAAFDLSNITYQQKRAVEYPPIGDQLDEIMKWLATETEIGIPDKLKSIAGKCMYIKSKYPKPTEE